jgi:lysophospholipase L1-like esterase
MKSTPFSTAREWKLKLVVVFLPIFFFGILDLGLQTFDIVPAEDPIMFHTKSFLKDFTPFVISQDDLIEIKPDWINREEVYRSKRGKEAGRFFLYPGFRPVRFSRVKPENTVRIFTVGGSTTFGQFVGAKRSFSGIIQEKLDAQFQNHKTEVINLGCSGLESTRVNILIETITKFDPDFIVVYAGHNEMLRGETDNWPPLHSMRQKLLSFSAIARWLNAGYSALFHELEYETIKEEEMALKEGAIPVYEQLAVPSPKHTLTSKAFMNQTASHYAENLHEMITKIEDTAIQIVFVLPIGNLLHPPDVSGHLPSFNNVGTFKDLLEDAKHELRSNQNESALSILDQAIKMSPEHAMTWYLRGITNLKLNQRDKGLEDLKQARDLDIRTHRMSSQLEQVLIDITKENQLPLVDLRPEFYKNLGQRGTNLFIDHVHPTKYGHQFVAQEILPYLIKH